MSTKNPFLVTGFWTLLGLIVIVILVWDFLQKPSGGIGIARTVGGFFQNVIGLAAGKTPTAKL